MDQVATQSQISRRVIRSAELCEKMGNISNSTLWRYVKSGTLPAPFKVGQVNYWYEGEIDASIGALAQKQAA